VLLCLRVAQHRVIVRIDEQIDVVGIAVLEQAAFQRLIIPLLIVLSFELGSSLAQVVVTAAQQNDRIGVDVLLELGGVLFGELFGVLRLLLVFIGNLISFLIDLLLLWLGLLRGDEEDLEGCRVANGVTIEDVASILAVVLAQPPAESLAHHL